jgi:hypothetical protein
MLGTTDLTNVHDIERLRRSVAMLRPGAPVFDREESLRLLTVVAELARRPSGSAPS